MPRLFKIFLSLLCIFMTLPPSAWGRDELSLEPVSKELLCEALLKNANLPPYLWEATKQCVGNCAYHAKQRANEYLSFLLNGRRVDLNIAFVTVNRLRPLAQMILRNALSPHMADLLHRMQIGGYLGEFNKEGDLPRAVGIQEHELLGFKKDLQKLLEELLVKMQAAADVGDGAHMLFKDTVSEKYWNAYQNALAEVERFYDERGAGSEMRFQFEGVEYTPREFSASLGLSEYVWSPKRVGVEFSKGISRDSKTIQDFIREHKFLRVTLSKMQQLVVEADLKKFYIEPKEEPKEDAEAEPPNAAHATLIVGMSNDDDPDPYIFIQNSWGPTTLGPQGLIPIRLSIFTRYAIEFRVLTSRFRAGPPSDP